MKTTTVGNLIAALENYDPEQPVMLMTQENYPLRAFIAGVVDRSQYQTNEPPAEDDRDPCECAPGAPGRTVGPDHECSRCGGYADEPISVEDNVVYILEGSQPSSYGKSPGGSSPYGDKDAWCNAITP